MKCRSYHSLLFFLLCLCTRSSLLSQAPINILSIQQGLPRSQIYDIVQDSFGFIWLGTRDGLVKYDGHTPIVYQTASGSLPFNYTYDLFIDHKNRLWFSSNADYQGAASMDLHTNNIIHYNKASHPTLSNNGVVAITEDINHQLAFLTKDFELNILDEERDTFKSWILRDYLPGKKDVANVSDIICDPYEAGVYWISSILGIFKFDTNQDKFTYLLFSDGWAPTNFLDYKISKDFLWVSLALKGGLLKIDTKNSKHNQFFSIETSRHIENELSTHQQPVFIIYDIAQKSADELYVCTANRGIGTFNMESGKFDFSQHTSILLETDFVRSLYSNAKGELWAGADKSGLYYLRPESAQLSMRVFSEKSEMNSQFRMSDIAYLPDNKYLLSFFREPEVWIWDRITDDFEKTPLPSPSDYADNILIQDDKIFLGSPRGIIQFDRDRKIFNAGVMETKTFSYVNNMISDSSGTWFIHWGHGVAHFKDSLRQFPGLPNSDGLQHTWTHDLAFGPDDQVWVGQETGLYAIDKKSNKITTFSTREDLRGFGNPNFKALGFDVHDRIWTGNFGTGIHCFDIEKGKVIYKLSGENGLPSDRVYDLILDDDGYFWVWTSDGLCSFFPDSSLTNMQFQYYPDTKYFPVDRLGVWFTKLKNGEIFFGVSGGFAHFDPKELRGYKEDNLTAPVLTGFKIFDQAVPFLQLIKHEHPLKLKPKQNFFSISFSAPKSGFLSRQQYNYRLEGVDQGWVNSENRRVATYTGIAPGTYQFRTRVGNQNGLWSESSDPLIVIVAAPWYATTLAKFLWVLLLISFAYAINRIFIIRERMTAQLKLQQIEAQTLRNLDEAKSTFFTQISHEFRTPLTVILGMADLLKTQIIGKSSEMVFAIERNGKQLLKQINQILDLSKLQSKSVQLELIQHDIISYLRYLTQSFVTYAESKKIQLRFSTTSDEMIMDYDPERVRDVLSNLISNALKFTPANGEISIKARKIVEKDRSFLELLISDRGAGISEDDITHIFEPYYQGKTRNKSLGTGLGLATTRQWINAMGGQIQVQSALGKGSTFIILLPITNSAPTQPSAGQNELQYEALVEPWEVKGKEQQVERSSILLIEDHMDVVNYIRFCLLEFDIVHATDGEEGIKRAIEDVPDLIITDIMMPLKDGYEVSAILRSNDATSHIPIIMLTAKATQEEKRIGLSMGADAYLTKPFDQKELNIRVHGLLSQRRLLQEKYSQRLEVPEILINDVEDQFLDQIQYFVESHLDKNFTVEDLAAHLHMSRVQLYRKVKALTGKSVSLYIRLIRLHRARKLLLSTQKNVTEVAYETGFSDPSYFSRVFKEEFSVNPSEVRKN